MEYENRNLSISLRFTYDNYVYLSIVMPIHKKIIRISQEEYERLKPDFNTILDLYISDSEYYVIGTLSELKAAGVNLPSAFY